MSPEDPNGDSEHDQLVRFDYLAPDGTLVGVVDSVPWIAGSGPIAVLHLWQTSRLLEASGGVVFSGSGEELEVARYDPSGLVWTARAPATPIEVSPEMFLQVRAKLVAETPAGDPMAPGLVARINDVEMPIGFELNAVSGPDVYGVFADSLGVESMRRYRVAGR